MWHLLDEPSAGLVESVLMWASHRDGFIEALDDCDRHALAHCFGLTSAEFSGRVPLKPTEVPQTVLGIASFLASQHVSYSALRVVADGSTALEVDMDERAVGIADDALDAARDASSVFEDRVVSVDVFAELDQSVEFVDNVEASTDVEELRQTVRKAFTGGSGKPQDVAAQVCIAALVTDLKGTVVGTLVAGRVAPWSAELEADQWLQETARQQILHTQLPSPNDGLSPAAHERVAQLQRHAADRI